MDSNQMDIKEINNGPSLHERMLNELLTAMEEKYPGSIEMMLYGSPQPFNYQIEETENSIRIFMVNNFNPAYLEKIAKVCHQVNKAYCEINGDDSQQDWEQAEGWQRNSALLGVAFRINNPDAPVSAQHDSWMKQKESEGWVYGEKKDTEKKTHPCMVPFEKLPPFQRKKDELFTAIVNILK